MNRTRVGPQKGPDRIQTSARALGLALWLALWLGVAVAQTMAQPLLLVTDEEVARDAAALPAPITPRAVPRPDAPTIKVLSPTLGPEPLGSPIRIEVVFAAAPGAQIDPASFRVHYGALRLDLTGRIVSRVKVESTGLKVDEVVIPRGNHRLVLQIADTQARVGEVELRFTVQ